MTIESNSSQPSSSSTPEALPQPDLPPDDLDGASDNGLTSGLATQQALGAPPYNRSKIWLHRLKPSCCHTATLSDS